MPSRLKPIEFLYFYRIIDWENKITVLRAIGYTLFGYIMAGKFLLLPIFGNTLAVLGLILFMAVINDYYDWKIQGERNFLSSMAEKEKLNKQKVLIYCFLPLILVIPLIFINKIFPINTLSIILLAFFLVISTFYSLPPIRFKEKRFLGVISTPICAFILFLQACSLLRVPDFGIFFLGILIFLFHSYVEILHVSEDSLVKEEAKKINTPRALKLLKLFPLASLIISLAFIFYSPIFLITSFFSLIRLISLKKFKIEDIRRIRRNLFLPQWSLYEFLIYGALGLFQVF